ncbi:hypothetical protein [Rhizobium halophilum]|uniref:hypothetical protein n=1 Tax=Rhizobium halophilum TaxID=2846852 RepID=UPI001EFDA2C7|nr:hypothetical protein [Rhizobium halophilum]MCF6370698.1 hypothetical protein [Rhizobium halophilum]
MPARFIHVSFTSPAGSVERTMTVEETLNLMAKHAPIPELLEALIFLELDRMVQGHYQGSDWSITCRAVDVPPSTH